MRSKALIILVFTLVLSFGVMGHETPVVIKTEPNDDFSSAAEIKPRLMPGLLTGNPSVEKTEKRMIWFTDEDEDYYAVDLEKGDSMDVRVMYNSSQGDLSLEVYDPSENLLKSPSTERYWVSNPLNNSRTPKDTPIRKKEAEITAQTDGKHYIKVTGEVYEEVPYTLRVDDRFEQNDNPSSATPILPGTYTDLMASVLDKEYYSFYLEENETVNVSVDLVATRHYGPPEPEEVETPSDLSVGTHEAPTPESERFQVELVRVGPGADESFTSHDESGHTEYKDSAFNIKVLKPSNLNPNESGGIPQGFTGSGSYVFEAYETGTHYVRIREDELYRPGGFPDEYHERGAVYDLTLGSDDEPPTIDFEVDASEPGVLSDARREEGADYVTDDDSLTFELDIEDEGDPPSYLDYYEAKLLGDSRFSDFENHSEVKDLSYDNLDPGIYRFVLNAFDRKGYKSRVDVKVCVTPCVDDDGNFVGEDKIGVGAIGNLGIGQVKRVKEFSDKIKDVPGLKWMLGDEKVLLDAGGEKYYAEISDGKLESFEMGGGPDEDVTYKVETDGDTFEKVVDSEDPGSAFKEAYDNGEVKVEPQGFGNKLKFKAGETVYKVFS